MNGSSESRQASATEGNIPYFCPGASRERLQRPRRQPTSQPVGLQPGPQVEELLMLVRQSRHLHAVALGPLLLDAVECGGIDAVIGAEIAAEGEDVVEGVGERLALPHRRVGAAALPLLCLRAPELAPPRERQVRAEVHAPGERGSQIVASEERAEEART